MMRKMLVTVVGLSLSIAVWALSPQMGDARELDVFLPNDGGDGKMLIITYCTSCHDAAHIKDMIVAKAGSDENLWMNLIDRMIGIRGAPIPEEDVAPIAAYLTKYFGPTSSPKPGTPLTGSAKLAPAGGSTASGSAIFHQIGIQVQVRIEVGGLSGGQYVLYLQEKTDCSRIDGTEHRIVDFGNWEADAGGKIQVALNTAAITVADGPHSVAGQAVILGAAPDRIHSGSTADAGTAVACGVIEILTED